MKTLSSWLLVLALFLPVIAHAQNTEEEAGDVSEVDKDRVGPLRDRVRPVSGNLFLKKGRFELSPGVSVSFRDAFFTKYVFGLQLTYHPLESLGISLHGGYALDLVSGAAQICVTTVTNQQSTRGCKSPTYDQVNGRAPGQITLLGGLDLQWSPIYGKIALVAERFAHFDLYGLAGPTYVQYLGPAGAVGSVSMNTVGGNVGVGARFVFNRFITLRTELRDLIYSETVQTGSSLRNQFFFELGVSFFLPTSFGEGDAS
ncbi:MAG: outer membrane beta-barrel domain-containing protein [Myxococcaceae bacterium]